MSPGQETTYSQVPETSTRMWTSLRTITLSVIGRPRVGRIKSEEKLIRGLKCKIRPEGKVEFR